MTSLTKRLNNQSGQTATEYMLIIAVVVLGTVAGASFLVPQFGAAVQNLTGQITGILNDQQASTEIGTNRL